MYKKALLLLWAYGFCSLLGMAQTGGTISGSCRDASGALIPGATVTVRNVDTGLTREVITGEQGRYSAPNLPVGPYEVQVSLTGFQTEIRKGIEYCPSTAPLRHAGAARRNRRIEGEQPGTPVDSGIGESGGNHCGLAG